MTTSNIKDAGWFCHAPNKPRVHEEKALPPTSQIPGLSEYLPDYPPADEPKKLVIRDTDSKYIALCKMGGRSDLLRIPSPKARSNEAKAYPTVDWYYLEDIKKEEADKKQREMGYDEHYEPLLPDYMVHKEYAPHGDNHRGSQQQRRNPLTKDNTSVFEREGNSATNKTIRIQEAVPNGYGVRNEKQKGKKVSNMQDMPKYQRAKGHQGELEVERNYAKPMKLPTEEDKPMMSKILSFGYQRDWESDHDKWQHQEDLRQQQNAAVMHPGKQEKHQSEYQSQTISGQKGSTQNRMPSHGRRAPSGSSSASHRRTKGQIEQEQPAIFSLPSSSSYRN